MNYSHNPINVLSLFNGIGCTKVALDRAGIKVNHFFCSEVDKYAIAINQNNHYNAIELGDIKDWQNWNIPVKIDLIIGGFPCQSFSSAGKQGNFKDERGKLFFHLVDIINHYKPKWFICENVKMKKEYEDVISSMLGVQPVTINSALVSAQNRVRNYWCNFPVTQPEDKNIYIQEIIEDGYSDRLKSYCIDANYHKGGNEDQYHTKGRRQIVYTGALRGRRLDDNGTRKDYCSNTPIQQCLELKNDGKTNCLTTVQKDNVLVYIDSKFISDNDPQGKTSLTGKNTDATSRQSTRNLVPRLDNKSNTLSKTPNEQSIIFDNVGYRMLTVNECEALQTLEKDYTKAIMDNGKPVSKTQRLKCLGNAFTVDVISHILSCIKIEDLNK